MGFLDKLTNRLNEATERRVDTVFAKAPLLIKILRQRQIPAERLDEIRSQWPLYRAGTSPYAVYIEDIFHQNGKVLRDSTDDEILSGFIPKDWFEAPDDATPEQRSEARFFSGLAGKVAGENREATWRRLRPYLALEVREISPEALRRNEHLFIQFFDYFYDDLKSRRAYGERAGTHGRLVEYPPAATTSSPGRSAVDVVLEAEEAELTAFPPSQRAEIVRRAARSAWTTYSEKVKQRIGQSTLAREDVRRVLRERGHKVD